MAKIYFRSFYSKVNHQFDGPFWNCVCIPLTHGHYALVDAEDFQKISENKWGLSQADGNNNKYARSQKIPMHRVIINVPDGMFVDHKNHNGLDNRKINLRLCTKAQNGWNRLGNKSLSEYKGVSWNSRKKRWTAEIVINKKTHKLGRFLNEKDAARAYNIAAIEFQGEFALLNKIE